MIDLKAESLRLLDSAQYALPEHALTLATMGGAYATLYAAEQTRRVLDESPHSGVTIESLEEK